MLTPNVSHCLCTSKQHKKSSLQRKDVVALNTQSENCIWSSRDWKWTDQKEPKGPPERSLFRPPCRRREQTQISRFFFCFCFFPFFFFWWLKTGWMKLELQVIVMFHLTQCVLSDEWDLKTEAFISRFYAELLLWCQTGCFKRNQSAYICQCN